MSEVSTADCMFWILVLCSLSIVWLQHTLKLDYAQYNLCDLCVYSREITNMFLVSQESGLVENSNIGIYSYTINVISIKLCTMLFNDTH